MPHAYVYPNAVRARARTGVLAVATIANEASPSLATELNAASTVNVSCYLRDFAPAATTERGSAPRRLCTDETVESFGDTTYNIPDILYTHDPQEDDTVEDNDARAALVVGTELYLVERQGLHVETEAWAAGQLVNLHHVVLGPQVWTRSGDDAFAEFQIQQAVSYLEPPIHGVTVAA